jgi:hypothetical protein
MFDASFPEGWWYYFRSCDVATLTDEVIDITADHAQRIRSPLTAFPIFQLGGAVGRVGHDETAFNGRAAGHTFNINATTATRDGFEEERESGRAASGRPSSPTTPASTSTSSWTRASSGSAKPTAPRSTSGCGC